MDGWMADGIIRRRVDDGVKRLARAGWMDGMDGCTGLDFDPADTRKACSRQSAGERALGRLRRRRDTSSTRGGRLHAISNIYKINTRV
jgi:hypothetical protein